MAKQKTITLEGPICAASNGVKDQAGFPTHYKVIRITDSVQFAPRQNLNREMVAALCDMPDWKVTIVPPS